MKTPPYYRIWIYSVNGLLILMQSIFLYYTLAFLNHEWMNYFPLKQDQGALWQMWVSIALQYLVCLSGIFGAFFSSKKLLRIYWLFMIPFLVYDLVRAILWAIRFQNIHRDYSSFLVHQVEELEDSPGICDEWRELQATLNCCAPFNIASCSNPGNITTNVVQIAKKCSNCTYPLLRWFHSWTDVLGTIAYFIMYPLKLIVVIVLRQDIQELFGEIVYTDNQELYRHWAAPDLLEENNGSTSSQNMNGDSINSTISLIDSNKTFATR